MILVIGGTGTTGKETLRQLRHAGAEVRALVRSEEKVESIKGYITEYVVGDLNSRASVKAALEGVHHVFLVSPAEPLMAELHSHVVDEARGPNPPHIVRLSALGADADSEVTLAKWHGDADRFLEHSGVPYTILRPHFFMQNFVSMLNPAANDSRAFYAPMRDGRISLVDVRDIASVAVKTLMEPGHMGKTYDITGPFALSCTEMANVLTESLRMPVAYVDVPPAEAVKGFVNAGYPEYLAEPLVELYGVFAAGYAEQATDTIYSVTGEPARTFSDFVRDYAGILAG